MRHLFLLPLLLLSPLFVISQPKYDYNWFVATRYSSTDTAFGVTHIDFNAEPPLLTRISAFKTDIDATSASWSDGTGKFAYLTNGCIIVNSQYDTLQEGYPLNPGLIHDKYCKSGYLAQQGAIILPQPGNPDKQYLFHLFIEDFPVWGGAVTQLLYTKIDMALDGSLGGVTEKNLPLLVDTLCFGQMTAVRHANGEDWWLVVPENSTNGYYIFLLDSAGVGLYRHQNIGKVQKGRDWTGQAVFSPDGRYYVRADGHSGMEVLEFDRCKGRFFNARHYDPPMIWENVTMGAAIAPNSRYLYVSYAEVLWQFDLWADDVLSTLDTIGVYDGYKDPLPAGFNIMQLAPNGKIYLTTGNGTKVMHVVHQPDMPGQACQFEQHSLHLPAYYSFAPPNFPNYRLGAAPANYCDSLSSSVQQPTQSAVVQLRAVPNPADRSCTVTLEDVPDGECQLVVFDTWGRVVQLQQITAKTTELDVSNWKSGIYILKIQSNEKRYVGRLVVQHGADR